MTPPLRRLTLVAIALLAPLLWLGAGAGPDRVDEVDLSSHFRGLEGCFVLVDATGASTRVYNPERAAQGFLPASTFKIANSIIALETGVASGADFAMEWDDKRDPPRKFWPESWKRDQTLRSAFGNSVVWFYQEIARRIGEARMGAWVERLGYGNENPGPVLDTFWLEGDLRISPLEQVGFLQRFYFERLGLSGNTTSTMREIMVIEETPEYRLSGKTGTALRDPEHELGWLVGFVERGDRVHFFALNMEGDRVWEDWPPHKRRALVKQLLQELGVIP